MYKMLCLHNDENYQYNIQNDKHNQKDTYK